jgi:hypothetical protein
MLDIASIHLALMSKAHEEPVFSNTNAPCSLDCIYLRYNDNVQGGHELLQLPTNSLITRQTVTPLPLTPAIINQVHALGPCCAGKYARWSQDV